MKAVKFSTALIAMACVYLFQWVLVHTIDIYSLWPDFDVPMHYMGGFTAGMVGLAFHHAGTTSQHRSSQPWWYHTLFVASVTVMIAVAWEFHEFALDYLNRGREGWAVMQASIQDTMADLLIGLIGGLSAALIWRKHT